MRKVSLVGQIIASILQKISKLISLHLRMICLRYVVVTVTPRKIVTKIRLTRRKGGSLCQPYLFKLKESDHSLVLLNALMFFWLAFTNNWLLDEVYSFKLSC